MSVGTERWQALAVFLCLAAGCAGSADGTNAEALVLDEDLTLEGQVTAVDATPMFVDGDGLVSLRTSTHGAVTLHVPARERLCDARGLGSFMEMKPDDWIRARGRVTGRRAITVCLGADHFLEVTSLPDSTRS